MHLKILIKATRKYSQRNSIQTKHFVAIAALFIQASLQKTKKIKKNVTKIVVNQY